MNRAVQRLHQRRCALKNNVRGGGFAINPAATFVSDNGVPYAENQQYNECYAAGRPGALSMQANPALAQVAQAGGRRNRTRGGCGCAWKRRGGACGQRAWLGGTRKRGGGFEMAVAQNIGGNGPIAEPMRIPLPCDPRAGMQNPFTTTPVQPDPRSSMGYSLTPNKQYGGHYSGQLSERIPNFEYSQTGAGYSGNAYAPECYRAPGSQMPIYPATSAGFHFTPSTEGGATLPDGMTAFNEVVAHTARLGGARKTRRRRAKKMRS